MIGSDYITTSIKSYKARLEGRKEDVIAAIRQGFLLTAQFALAECLQYEAAIAELEFELEVLEVDDD